MTMKLSDFSAVNADFILRAENAPPELYISLNNNVAQNQIMACL